MAGSGSARRGCVKEGERAWWPQKGITRLLEGKGPASQPMSLLREIETDLKDGTLDNFLSNQEGFCYS